MKFNPSCRTCGGGNQRRAGFTLAEVLAALVFMAIVIPVAVEGLRIASYAGNVAARKRVAARIADRLLNEYRVSGSLMGSQSSGTAIENDLEYRWRLQSGNSELRNMRLVTVEVTFPAQDREQSVAISTLVGVQP